MADKPHSVTVVGGGIAGITAALKLAQRGYDVTLYEQREVLGGNLAAVKAGPPVDGVKDPFPPNEKLESIPEWHDVYPHMFSSFYRNFWDLIETDLGWSREAHFQPRHSVKVFKDGAFVTLTNGAPLRDMWSNIRSGLVPPADMIVYGHTVMELIAERARGRDLADTVTVNGFVGSRPYATPLAAQLHDFILTIIWSAHSYEVPASAYGAFQSFTLRDNDPWSWVLRGNLQEHLMGPLEKKLESLDVTIKKCCEIRDIQVLGGRVHSIDVSQVEWDGGHKTAGPAKPKRVPVENLVLAVDPRVTGKLAQKVDELGGLVTRIPELSETRRAHAEPVLVLDLYFKHKIPDVPKEHVSVWDSRFGLSFLDLSQAWKELEDGPTVLVVAASNYFGLPTESKTRVGSWQDLVAMGFELNDVLPQASPYEVDLERTYFHVLRGHDLFINTAGSEMWRPATYHEAVPNLFLAGAYVENPVGMATVEGAVTSGLLAAQALQERTGLGAPVEVPQHRTFPPPLVDAMKLGTMPSAYAAKWWSVMTDLAQDVAYLERPIDAIEELASLWALPGYFVLDAWRTSTDMWLSSWDYLSQQR